MIPERVGVLGPGGVGGALAVHLSQAGFVVVVVARSDAYVFDRGVLTLDWRGRTLTAEPYATTLLDGAVDLLLVTVKAPDLEAALDRVEPQAVERAVILPLMNGLEHVATIRARFPGRVAAGSIGRLEAYKTDATHVVQTTGTPLIAIASDDLARDDLESAAEILRRGGVEVEIGDSEQAVLWEKAVRVVPLSTLTALAQRPIGEVRADPTWRPLLEAAVAESSAVATADGAPQDPAEHLAVIDGLRPGATTSLARDVAAGRPSELDAMLGGVIRAGRRVGVPTPTLDDLYERCRGS